MSIAQDLFRTALRGLVFAFVFYKTTEYLKAQKAAGVKLPIEPPKLEDIAI